MRAVMEGKSFVSMSVEAAGPETTKTEKKKTLRKLRRIEKWVQCNQRSIIQGNQMSYKAVQYYTGR
jgi:hypothetical protein